MTKYHTPALQQFCDPHSPSCPTVSACFDKYDSNSLLHKAEGKLLKSLVDLKKDLLCLSMSQIRAKVRVSSIDTQLRRSFWREYFRSVKLGCKMEQHRIWRGCCSDVHWRDNILTSPYKLGYILQPIRDIPTLITDIYHDGLEKLEHVIQHIPLINPKTGELNAKNFNLFQKHMIFLHKALYGEHTQKQITAHVPVRAKQPQTVEEIDEELARLREIGKGSVFDTDTGDVEDVEE